MSERDGQIAIVGAAGRFPGAPSLAEFWSNLRGGVETIAQLSDDELRQAGVPEATLRNENYVKVGARLEGLDQFDAGFFGYPSREAEIMDPQHRVFLEVVWEALEDAAVVPDSVDARVGVFGGASTTAYLPNIFSNLDEGRRIREANVGIGLELGFLATRVSYKLNLTGPSFPVHTACSTSLVAVHLACQSLLSYECDVAIAGASAFKVPPGVGYLYQQDGILSADGHCRPFDRSTSGTVFGNGVGAVILKRADDAIVAGDPIRGLIIGSAVNNDGAQKASFTAPSIQGQASVVLDALSAADLDARSVGFIEAHGSGTQIGDSIEVQALSRAFRPYGDDVGFCRLGSVKSNVGHLDAAAGMAGLLKVLLSLQHGEIPPTLHYRDPNVDIDFDTTPFRVNNELERWPASDMPRRAGVSSFGFGGTNAHVIIEEAPTSNTPPCNDAVRPLPIVVSARTPSGLDTATDRWVDHLEAVDDGQPLADLVATAATGRKAFEYGRIVVASTPSMAADRLARRDPTLVLTGRRPASGSSVAMLFAGRGSLRPGSVDGLYGDDAAFHQALDECAALFRQHNGRDLRLDILGPDRNDTTNDHSARPTDLDHAAAFALEFALVEMWRQRGVEAGFLMGHGLGELLAASVAGVFDLSDVVAVVARREELIQATAPGAMARLGIATTDAADLLPPSISVAVDEGATSCVISGPVADVETLIEDLSTTGRSISVERLATNRSLHSSLLDPVLAQFESAVAQCELRPPKLPIVSTVTGTWMSADEATSPTFWSRHLRAPVQLADGLRCLTSDTEATVLEIGSGHGLPVSCRRSLQDPQRIVSTLPDVAETATDHERVARAIGQLWLSGVALDWSNILPDQRRPVPAPTYPFERSRYWIDPQRPATAAVGAKQHPNPLLDAELVTTVDRAVFGTTMSLDTSWILREHRMADEALLPGTALIEMARAAGEAYASRSVTELADVTFSIPMLVRDGERRTVHTTVRDSADGRLDFSIASRTDGPESGDWIEHATGSLGFDRPVKPAPIDLGEEQVRCNRAELDAGRLQAEHEVMDFGGRWTGSLRRIHIGPKRALGRVELPTEYLDDLDTFALHPAILDVVTGFGEFAVLDEDTDRAALEDADDFFLPLAYERIVVHHPLPARSWSVMSPHGSASFGPELRKLDVLVVDDAGEPVLEISGFTAKRVHNPSRLVNELASDEVIHSLQWRNCGSLASVRLPPAEVLVLGSGVDVGPVEAEFRSRGWQVTTSILGPKPVTEVGLATVLDSLGTVPPVVVYLDPSRCRSDDTVDAVSRDLATGAAGVFFLAKAMAARPPDDIRLVVVTPSAAATKKGERVRPAAAAVLGVAKAIGHELDHVTVGLIDRGEAIDAARVVDEALATDGLPWVALRGEQRLAPELTPRAASTDEPEHSSFEHTPYANTTVEHTAGDRSDTAETRAPSARRVYLITGGSGGLGQAVARWVTTTHPTAAIVLLGRRPVPEPVAKGAVSDLRAVIAELKEAGNEVRYLQADVTDLEAMAATVATVRAEVGRVTDVVHAAGVAGDGFIFRKDHVDFDTTMSPKTVGTLVLDTTMADDPPDRTILFSSTVALWSTVGQSDYTAANMFLDAYAADRTARGLSTLSINWTDWLGTGMADTFGVAADQGFFRSISVADATRQLDVVMDQPGPQLIVGRLNTARLRSIDRSMLDAFVETSMIRLPESLVRGLRRQAQTETTDQQAADPSTPLVEVDLTGGDGEYTDLERRLAAAWAAELGLDELDVTATLFDVGGDSLIALRIANGIRAATGRELTMADMFQHLTVEGLARHLESSGEVHLGDADPADGSPSSADQRRLPLTGGQVALWQLQHVEGGGNLNLPAWDMIDQRIDAAALQKAVDAIVARHDALRICFGEDRGGVWQQILPDHRCRVAVHDVEAADPERTAREMIEREAQVELDLASPTLRVHLYRLGSDRSCVLVNLHHLVADGLSMAIVHQELMAAYQALSNGAIPPLDPLAVGFADAVRAEHRWLNSDDAAGSEAFWQEHLGGPLPDVGLADIDHPSAPVVDYREFRLGPELTSMVSATCRDLAITPSSFYLSSLVATITAVTAEDDMVIGVAHAGREHRDLEGVVGLLVNLVAVRVTSAGHRQMGALAQAVASSALEAYGHAKLPFSRVVEVVNPPRRAGRNPFYRTTFQFTRFLPPALQTPQTELSLFGRPDGDDTLFRVTHDPRLVSPARAAAVADAFQAVVASATGSHDIDVESVLAAASARSTAPVDRSQQPSSLQRALAARLASERTAAGD